MPAFQDLTGQRFGRLVAISYAGTSKWLCKCDCGREIATKAQSLKDGVTRSCGCLRIEMFKTSVRTHGRSHDSVYRTWRAMINRCENKNLEGYYLYGGKGVRVCERWRNSFEAFLEDMGEKPSPAHSIDRIDGSLDYSPDNCRWATKREQADNTSRNTHLTFQGETLNVTQWARKLGINPITLFWRLANGWSVEEILKTPARRNTPLTFQGETLSIAAWARRVGLSKACLRDRLYAGWSVEEALFTPSQRKS
jgi:hypothetical protein